MAEYHIRSFLSVYIAQIFLSALESTLLSWGMNYCTTSWGKHAINLSQVYVESCILRLTSQFPNFCPLSFYHRWTDLLSITIMFNFTMDLSFLSSRSSHPNLQNYILWVIKYDAQCNDERGYKAFKMWSTNGVSAFMSGLVVLFWPC